MQFSKVFTNGFSCPHESRASEVGPPLEPKKWKDGHSERDAPGKLYGKDSVMLLMSRVYVGPHGHELPTHDPRILQQLIILHSFCPSKVGLHQDF